MALPSSHFMRIAAAALVSALVCAGCDSVVNDITGSSTPSPGGTFTAQLDAYPSVTLTAIGTGDPFTVTATSSTFVVSIICGPAGSGDTTKAALAVAGGSVVLQVAAGGPTELQAHANGTSCIGDTGLVSITQTNGSLNGSFSAHGHDANEPSTACEVSGTLTAIPIKE